MKMSYYFRKNFINIFLLFFTLSAHAAMPMYSFTPLTATSIIIDPDSTAIIQYLVTNNSPKTHTLEMIPIKTLNQITTGGTCPHPFTLGYNQSCTLSIEVNGSLLTGNIHGGPKVCTIGNNLLQCYQPELQDLLNIEFITINATNISASLESLALQVSGVARIITITNNGADPAQNITFTPSPAFPAGTTMNDNCGTSLAAGASCTLTITPGPIPSAPAADLNPTPITLTISGSNTNTVTPLVNILTYASVFQSGYVFAFDDTTSNDTSVGGKVAALNDQSMGIIWSSDNGGNTVYDAIPGIYQDSTTPCVGNIAGDCNSEQIVTFYSPPNTNPMINVNLYAAGLCTQTIGDFDDWYLPAICEMGYDTFQLGSTCDDMTVQTMQSNLVSNGVNFSQGAYWSSTQSTIPDPASNAWSQLFGQGFNAQGHNDKDVLSLVRCVRAMSP